MNFPAIKAQELTGLEEICSGVKVIDYWAWAHSDLVDNIERGIFIKVKSSGYIQSWGHDELSPISFSIGSSEESDRQSDVYVFCIHKHTEQDSLNILDLEQWTFFVLPTAVLNDKVGRQKTITLNRIKALGAVETDYYNLRETVIQAANHNKGE